MQCCAKNLTTTPACTLVCSPSAFPHPSPSPHAPTTQIPIFPTVSSETCASLWLSPTHMTRNWCSSVVAAGVGKAGLNHCSLCPPPSYLSPIPTLSPSPILYLDIIFAKERCLASSAITLAGTSCLKERNREGSSQPTLKPDLPIIV